MSKIAEQKALEAYPTPLDNEPFISTGFVEEKNREGYIKGYDQAMQDFIEKACEWLRRTQPKSILPDTTIERFKNYMEK